MTNGLMGYTTRANVENFLKKTFPEVTDAEFNVYLKSAERYVDNYCGYNSETTTSGLLQESIVREKSVGKVDNFGNLVVDLHKPPIAFDAFGNPRVSLLEFNLGSVRITLNLTDGTGNNLNTVLEVSENRKKVYYSSIYFLPAISTVTPTQKVNLFNLRDVRFWTDISYIGGYPVLPEDIVMATTYVCADLVMHRFNPMFLSSFTQGTMTQTFAPMTNNKGKMTSQYIQTANTLLQPYIRYTW